jgi:hypothetical protein
VERNRVGSVSCERLLVAGFAAQKALVEMYVVFRLSDCRVKKINVDRVCGCGHEVSSVLSRPRRHFILLFADVLDTR